MSISAAQEAVSDHGSTLLNLAITFIVLEILVVGLWYVATYLNPHRAVGLDDVSMPLALVFNIGLCVICILRVTKGSVGHHIHWVEQHHPTSIIAYKKIQVVYLMVYALACTFSKLAILGLYQRIFVERRDRIISYALMAIVCLWSLSAILCNGLQCVPLAFLWNPKGHPGGYCFNINEYWKWLSFPNILTDIAILLLPFPCIWKLRLSRRIKIGLAVTFCTGSIGLITSIIRFTTFFHIINEGKEVDFTYTSVKLSSVSIAESGFYLFAACLPNFRYLLRIVQQHVSVSGGSRSDMRSQGTPKKDIFLSTRDAKCLDSDGTALNSNGTFTSNKTLVGSRGEKASSIYSERELYSPTCKV